MSPLPCTSLVGGTCHLDQVEGSKVGELLMVMVMEMMMNERPRGILKYLPFLILFEGFIIKKKKSMRITS